MTMKELAYTAKFQLESATHQSFRHAHVHELLAACFGFKSSTALHTGHVLAVLTAESVIPAEYLLNLESRLVGLGYQPEIAGPLLSRLMQERRISILSVEAALAALDHYSWEDQDDWGGEDEDEDGLSAQYPVSIDRNQLGLLIDGLQLAAKRDNSKAHFALALLHRAESLSVGEGSQYWHSQLAQGNELTEVQLEWAKAYSDNIANAEREAFHLQEAARLGYGAAQLERAHLAIEDAHERGDYESAKYGYVEAARLGDVGAMRALIEEYDAENLFQNWVWVFFSELLGNDLREGSLRAYHDGGMYADEDYDDDQGGPMYIGGDQGVELEGIGADLERNARDTARQLFSELTR